LPPLGAWAAQETATEAPTTTRKRASLRMSLITGANRDLSP
jgi:hypothetical protein